MLTSGGRCEQHQKQQAIAADARRGTAQERGYTYRWSQISQRFLARFPLCGMRADGARHREHSFCTQQGRYVAAECTDHIVAKQAGGTDEESNLQALCLACNSRKAALYEGGYGHQMRHA